jgi:DNA uptake protein ComE-like DNA-binding protein
MSASRTCPYVMVLAFASLVIGLSNQMIVAAPAVPSLPLLDLNSATETQLQTLPGVGDATAKKIIAGRPFNSVDDLTKAGLSKATIEKIKPLVTVKGAASQPAEMVNLNTASEEQLQEVPGIGPAYAAKIVKGRPYKSVDDLAKAGLPKATIEKIRPHVTVQSEAAAITRTPPKAGMVWVNTDSGIYHKEGSRWYGKTKEGKFMAEQDAKKQSFKAAANEEKQ